MLKYYISRVMLLSGIFVLLAMSAQAQNSESPDFSRWNGNWKRVGKKEQTWESWQSSDVCVLQGRGYEVRGTDTLITEHLKLLSRPAGFFYSAQVMDQNQSRPVEFKLTHFTRNSWNFENPAHDFPSRITYTYQRGMMKVMISGRSPDGKVLNIPMVFRKKK